MDMQQIMKMAAGMKEKLEKIQTETQDIAVYGQAGGQQVQVHMNGRYEITKMVIAPSLVRSADVALLEDLVTAAVNDAVRQVGEVLRSRLGPLVSQMGL